MTDINTQGPDELQRQNDNRDRRRTRHWTRHIGKLRDAGCQHRHLWPPRACNTTQEPPVASKDASPNLTQKVIALNLLAPLNLAQAAYGPLETSNGSIVNISSVSATRSSPGSVAYGAAKAGLLNVTTSLAMEWARAIRVNAVIVGLVKTEASADHYGGEKGVTHLASNLPMKRMGTPQDIAKACLFLADPTNSYISGACLEVFGGGEPPSFLKIAEEAHKLK